MTNPEKLDVLLQSTGSRRALLRTLAAGAVVAWPANVANPNRTLAMTTPVAVPTEVDPLPSWNDGPAKKSILDFVAAATDDSNPGFVPVAERIATFDQDGTLWVEHPIYTQGVFTLDRIKILAASNPDWKTKDPFATVLSGDQKAIATLSEEDWEQIIGVTHAGMSVEDFLRVVAEWMTTARDPHFDRLYIELVYQPMLEVMSLLRDHGFMNYIVSGGGQEFIRAYAQPVYGIPPQQVIGTTFETKYEVQPSGTPVLIKEPKLQINDNYGGKPEAINLLIGRRPVAAFGNSTGDQQMLEWADAGTRAHLALLVYHDDARREYAYGPAGGLPDTTIGTFTTELMTEARTRGWTVVSMKNDWREIFAPA